MTSDQKGLSKLFIYALSVAENHECGATASAHGPAPFRDESDQYYLSIWAVVDRMLPRTEKPERGIAERVQGRPGLSLACPSAWLSCPTEKAGTEGRTLFLRAQ